MKLSLNEKWSLYHDLGRLLRGGRAFPSAVDFMRENAGGNLRRFLQHLHAAAVRGETVSEAFAGQQPAVTELELSLLRASEQAGRLDQACTKLAGYFAVLEKARATIRRRMMYPTFLLHFGVFATSLPKLLLGGSGGAYLRETLGLLLLIYAGVLVLWIGGKALVKAAETSASVDAFLRAVPLVGRIRRSFALARFCTTYEAQTVAGVNVFDALASAGHASGSGLIAEAVRKGMNKLRTGASVGSVLQESRAFPKPMARAFHMAEETGDLDAELARLTAEFEADALARTELLSGLVSRGIYFLIAIYVGYRIVRGYLDVAMSYEKMLDF